jgi:hypothetical protein
MFSQGKRGTGWAQYIRSAIAQPLIKGSVHSRMVWEPDF